VEIFKNPTHVDRLLDNDDILVEDISPLTPDIMRVAYKDNSEKVTQPLTNSLVMGVLVTSYARLHLYSFMRTVGTKLLYCGK
jgi:hypothetical protein